MHEVNMRIPPTHKLNRSFFVKQQIKYLREVSIYQTLSISAWKSKKTMSRPDIKCTSLLLLEIVKAQQPYNIINNSGFLLTRFHCNRLHNEDCKLRGLKRMWSEILQSDWDARFLAPCTSWAMACHPEPSPRLQWDGSGSRD